jgi:presenilin-like A22 family membrane protease
MFLVAQFIGLVVFSSYDNYFGKTSQEKVARGELVKPNVSFVNETLPPPVELKEPIDIAQILIAIIIALIIATALFFLLAKVRIVIVLKIWFAVVVFICLTIALALVLYPFIGTSLFSIFGKNVSLAEAIALPAALVLTFYKIVKRNIIVHNLTELFIYPGIAIIFLPLLNVIAASILLVAISIYDMIAVWKTKYMIKLAKFQIQQMKIFTGFFVPYIMPKDKARIAKMRAMAKQEEKQGKRKKKGKEIKVKAQIAALGGGDVAFPLIFAGTIFFAFGLMASIVTILCTSLALLLLLLFSEKGKFYPAMPFLTAGCFLGLLIVLLFL